MDDLFGLIICGLVVAFFAGWAPACDTCVGQRSSWIRECSKNKPVPTCKADAYELYHCGPTERNNDTR